MVVYGHVAEHFHDNGVGQQSRDKATISVCLRHCVCASLRFCVSASLRLCVLRPDAPVSLCPRVLVFTCLGGDVSGYLCVSVPLCIMSRCVCVFVCFCMCVSACGCLCVAVCLYVYVSMCLCACASVSACLDACVYVTVCLCDCASVRLNVSCVFVRLFLSGCVSLWLFVYVPPYLRHTVYPCVPASVC